MPSKALEAERARLKEAADQSNAPGDRHALSLADARTEHMVVHVNTPQRGTPFKHVQVGKDGAKETRDPINMGYVTATRVKLPAHDGLVTILPSHAPMVGLLGNGQLELTTTKASLPHDKVADRTVEIADGAVFRMFVSGGTFSVRDNKVLVLPERGFVADQLATDDIEDPETRKELQAKIAEGLEGDALRQAVRDAKRAEVNTMIAKVSGDKPSEEKKELLDRLRAMEKALS